MNVKPVIRVLYDKPASRHLDTPLQTIPVYYMDDELGWAVYNRGFYVYVLPEDLQWEMDDRTAHDEFIYEAIEPREGTLVNSRIVGIEIVD
jgi:hypothetical protein